MAASLCHLFVLYLYSIIFSCDTSFDIHAERRERYVHESIRFLAVLDTKWLPDDGYLLRLHPTVF